MAEILSKYSETINLETSGGQIANDLRTPYSYAEWNDRNVGIIPGKEQTQYQKYLLDWYDTRDTAKVVDSERLKADYKRLIAQISLTFREEQDEEWITNVNFDDPLELEQVIPFYAKKLKDIALYLINKREAVRKAKLKYNMTGAKTALEHLFYEYLLKAFTKRSYPGADYLTNVVEASSLAALPELSASIQTFQITIDELYDDSMYFDRDPTILASTYFDLSADSVVTYLSGLNISSDAYEWLYSTGVSQLCADNALFWVVDDVIDQYKNGVPLSAVESYDSPILNDYNRIALTNKYIGSNQNWVSGGYYELWTEDFDYNLQEGNNWFYWLSGEYLHESLDHRTVDTIPLSSTSLVDSGAEAGKTYKDSDVIFKRRGDGVEGAWLQLTDQTTSTPTMSARLDVGPTLFSFPYPGYGVSGEDLDWSGRNFSNEDMQFEFLDAETRAAIRSEYWSAETNSVSAFDPINIGNTQLVADGAHASKEFSTSDQIIIRYDGIHDTNPDGIYQGQQHYAWLYKMDTTDLPIARGANSLYWPLTRYTTEISYIAPSSQCVPMDLSGINIKEGMLGAIAGQSLESADKLFKMNSAHNGRVLGASWLSGAPAVISNITGADVVSGAEQPSLAFTIEGGGNAVFTWSDYDVGADYAFHGYKHQIDCDYLKETSISLYNDRIEAGLDIDYNQWQQCTCRSIMYTPFGHPGDVFDDYNGLSDYVVSLNTPVSSFSLASWRDHAGNDYRTSPEFGWFKLDDADVLEPAKQTYWAGFNGEDDYITSPNVIDFNNEFEIEIQGYFNSNQDFTFPHVISTSPHDTFAPGIIAFEANDPSDRVALILYPNGGLSRSVIISYDVDVFNDEWHSLKVTYDNGLIGFYIDNELYSESTINNYSGFGSQELYISAPADSNRNCRMKITKVTVSNSTGLLFEATPLTDGTMRDDVTSTVMSSVSTLDTAELFEPETVVSNEPDAGWRSGKWITNEGSPFMLREDSLYMYVRSNLNRDVSNDFNAPYLTSKTSFTNSKTEWVDMVYDNKQDRWMSTDTPSQLRLTPGDYLLYDHQESVALALTAENVIVTTEPYYDLPDFAAPTTIVSQASVVGLSSQQVSLSSMTDIQHVPSYQYSWLGGTYEYYGTFDVGEPTVTNVEVPYIDPTVPLTVVGSVSSPEIWSLSSGITSVSSLDIYNIRYSSPAANFKLEVPLSGWNYNTNTYDGITSGARPFWAKAFDDSSIQTKYKGIDYHGGSLQLVDDYIFVQQPELSDIILNVDMYMVYNRRNDVMFWYEPLTFFVDTHEKRWNKLIIDESSTSPLDPALTTTKDLRELVVQDSSEPSTMMLDIDNDDPLLVNYYAISGFTWSQTLSDSSLGIPPTGGVWVDSVSGVLVVPDNPHEYITNKHYPTYASVPYVGDLYSDKESGGYFVPKMLGVSTFVEKGMNQAINTLIIDPNEDGRGLDRVFRDININESDYGLSQTDQIAPISTLDIDSSWMKGAVTEWTKAGAVVRAREHQEFIPYQTAYETTRVNDNGIRRQGDAYDPWYGSTDSDWENNIDFPPSDRQQYNIEGWYDQFDIGDGRIYAWQTDIFGNQYALMKQTTGLSQYDKSQLEGSIWTRDSRKVISPGTESLERIYNKFTNFTIDANIKDFDIWYDTMMIQLSSALAFAKITFDYDDNIIFTIADDIHEVSLAESKFAGTWFFEQDKLVTICTVVSADTGGSTYFYPELRSLDLETNVMTTVFSPSGDTDLLQLSGADLTSYEDPVFTYNPDTKRYNIAFIGYSSTLTGMYFTTIDISQVGVDYEVSKVQLIIPLI